MATAPIEGLHHVTSVAGDPERNVRFYTEVLGLRLVKKTVNFDDISTYHLYYGNETGEPGTAITFFPFENSRPGKVGAGQVETTQFHVPNGSLDYWVDRFDDLDVDYDEPEERFDGRVLAFRDPDGLRYELVATDEPTAIEPWADGPVSADVAIRGFYGVSLAVDAVEPTAELLELMGYEQVDEAGARRRFETDGDKATVVDLVETDQAGRPGTGTVHHVAFRVADDEAQSDWRETLGERGFRVTPQKDRQYFRSVYFRERNGILFELATEGPGFTADEAVDELGEELKLPPWLADDREQIESALPPLKGNAEVSQ